tara:strand:+ start:229 stop:825 length:597 start_codon:yes stop_codon:yes gene_type:complete
MNPDKIRKVYAPYSTTGEQVGQTPLTGYVDVAQAIYPAVNTGQISKAGEWSGVIVDDKQFRGLKTAEGIANTANVLFPDTVNFPSIDMTGFNTLVFAIKTNRAGNYALDVLMGPDTTPFANLSPVDSGGRLRMINSSPSTTPSFSNILEDSAEALTGDVWEVFFIYDRCAGQKNMQINVTNNSGGEADIEFGFMRLVK